VAEATDYQEQPIWQLPVDDSVHAEWQLLCRLVCRQGCSTIQSISPSEHIASGMRTTSGPTRCVLILIRLRLIGASIMRSQSTRPVLEHSEENEWSFERQWSSPVALLCRSLYRNRMRQFEVGEWEMGDPRKKQMAHVLIYVPTPACDVDIACGVCHPARRPIAPSPALRVTLPRLLRSYTLLRQLFSPCRWRRPTAWVAWT